MNAESTMKHQRGLSLVQLLFGSIVVIFVAIGAMKVVPAYLENKEISGILHTIATDPAMQKADPRDIRDSFDKRALINSITVVNSSEINIDTSGDRPVLTITYQEKIPLIGNATLLLDFTASSVDSK